MAIKWVSVVARGEIYWLVCGEFVAKPRAKNIVFLQKDTIA